MSTTGTGVKIKRLRAERALPGLLWRVMASLVLGGGAFYLAVPWAAAQRGYAALGGEYLLVLGASVLPFCLFRR